MQKVSEFKIVSASEGGGVLSQARKMKFVWIGGILGGSFISVMRVKSLSLMLEHLLCIREERITKTENNSWSVPEYC